MARQLKRWESPRREGRNAKGKGGSARKRQKQKQLKAMVRKLKHQSNRPPEQTNDKKQKGRVLKTSSLLLLCLFYGWCGRSVSGDISAEHH
jgi:hypothetical protein